MPNQPVFGTLYTLDRFVYRQNSTLLYCTIKEIIILKIACFGVIYVPFSRVITRYYAYFFTRVALEVPVVECLLLLFAVAWSSLSLGLSLGLIAVSLRGPYPEYRPRGGPESFPMLGNHMSTVLRNSTIRYCTGHRTCLQFGCVG